MDILYTYGGGHLLYNVFNGVAYLTNPDLPFWGKMLGFSTLIGLMWASMTALAKVDIGLFAKKWFIPSFILLNVLLIPRTTLNIVDEVDPTFGADRVDNLPVGLVAIIGASSAFSRALVEAYEDVFDTADLARFTKTGFAFGSRLTQEARTLRIADPRVRQNVKDWTDQCIWLPYLKTNIGGKRESARTSDDLISWVEEHGHPSLGTYWRNEDGSQTYRTCKVSAPLIREAMTAQGQRGFSALGAKLFGFRPEGVDMNGFKPIMQEAWQMISKSTKSASQQVQQMMVVNAQKEAFDDSREKFKYPRLHPELVSMNAARALETQGMTGMMNAFTSSVTMPLLQATMLGLLCLLFVIIVGFYFMPGGINKFWLFVKLMFSFQLWPVLSSMLNSLSLFWLKKSSEDALQGIEGFTIATISGLSDAAWSVGSWAAGMQLIVPVLAWGVVSGSPYVMSTIVGGLTSGLQGLAGKYAGEAADGNVSMGNQNFFNETIASRSVAQQNHVGSSGFAGTLNTGSQTITNAADGTDYIAQNSSALRESYSSSGVMSSAIGNTLRDSEALTAQNSNNFNTTLGNTSGELLSFNNKLANGNTITNGASTSGQASIQKTATDTQNLINDIAKTHGVSAQTVIDATVRGGFGGKILGFELGASASTSTGAANNEVISKIQNSNEGKQLAENLSTLTQYAKDHRGQITDSSGNEMTEGLTHSFNKTRTAAEAYNHSYTKTKNLENMKTYNDQKQVGSTANENDPFLNYVSKQTGLSKADIVPFLNKGGQEVDALKTGFMKGKEEMLRARVGNIDHVLDKGEIQKFMSDVPTINKTGRDVVQNKIDHAGFKTAPQLTGEVNIIKAEARDQIKFQDQSIDSQKNVMSEHNKHRHGEFQFRNNQTNIRRQFEKGAGDIGGTVTSLSGEQTAEERAFKKLSNRG